MDTDVLVVGAGPTGLMLANQLVRRGIRTLMGDHLRELGCSVQWNTELVSLMQQADCVTAVLKMPDGSHRNILAAWVAGCDGEVKNLLAGDHRFCSTSPREEGGLVMVVPPNYPCSPGESACLRSCLKQILPSPGIEFLQNRPEISSERGQRVFNTHRHFGEHLSFDESVPLKFSQLLRQYLLRDSRHALPEDIEPERLFGAHKPPENDWFPAAANQDEQFLDRTLADNTFGAYFNFGDQVSIWVPGIPFVVQSDFDLTSKKAKFRSTRQRLAAG